MNDANRLDVPEVAAYGQHARVTAYAFRHPGAILWSGFASGDGRQVTTEARYRSPADAVEAARHQLEGAVALTRDLFADAITGGWRQAR